MMQLERKPNSKDRIKLDNRQLFSEFDIPKEKSYFYHTSFDMNVLIIRSIISMSTRREAESYYHQTKKKIFIFCHAQPQIQPQLG